MSSSISAFWWAPLRFPGLLKAELSENPRMWFELGKYSRRTLTNFGDELNPLVLRYMSGREVRWSKPRTAQVVCLGSVLELFAECGGHDALVLGCGLRTPLVASSEEVQSSLSKFEYMAVRGPETARSLGLSQVCEADPGVLSDRLKFERLGGGKLGPIYIPHFRTWADRAGRDELRFLESLGVKIVPPSISAEAMLSAISGASVVYSSSLHGIICSHSLGRPVVWVSLNNQGGREPVFKYNDYFKSIFVDDAHPISVKEIGSSYGDVVLEKAMSDVSIFMDRTDSMAEALASVGYDALR